MPQDQHLPNQNRLEKKSDECVKSDGEAETHPRMETGDAVVVLPIATSLMGFGAGCLTLLMTKKKSGIILQILSMGALVGIGAALIGAKFSGQEQQLQPFQLPSATRKTPDEVPNPASSEKVPDREMVPTGIAGISSESSPQPAFAPNANEMVDETSSEFTSELEQTRPVLDTFAEGGVKSFTAEFCPIQKECDPEGNPVYSEEIPGEVREALDGFAEELGNTIDYQMERENGSDANWNETSEMSFISETPTDSEMELTRDQEELIKSYRAIFHNRKQK